MAEEEQPVDNGEEKVFNVEKIYLKDVSFETPNSPGIFLLDWKPTFKFEVQGYTKDLDDDHYEVVLTITTVVKVGEKTAFLAEVHQAGIFLMKGYDAEVLERTQNIYCFRILYPYASAAMSDLVSKGGFPQFVPAPLNFSALYEQRKKSEAGTKEKETV